MATVDGTDRAAVERALAKQDGELVFEQDCVIEEVENEKPPEARIIEVDSGYTIRSADPRKPVRVSRAEGARYRALFAPRGFDVHNALPVEKLSVRDIILDGGPDGRRDWPRGPNGEAYDIWWEHRHLFITHGVHDLSMHNVLLDHPVADGVLVAAVWADRRGWAVGRSVPTKLRLDLKFRGSKKNRNAISFIECDDVEYTMDSEGSSRYDMPASDDFEPDNVADREGFPYAGYIARIANVKGRCIHRNNKANVMLNAQFPNTLIENVELDITTDRLGDWENYGKHGGDPEAPIQWIENPDHSVRNTGRIRNIKITQRLFAPVVPEELEPIHHPDEVRPPIHTVPDEPVVVQPKGRGGCVVPIIVAVGAGIAAKLL